MLKVKLGRPAIPHILGCVALLARRVNLSVVKVVITYLATCNRLLRHGGVRYLVVYQKACSSILQQAIGGQKLHDLGPFGARVGRTHSGLPSIIPALHRARIRQGCTWTIRFWATLFGIYRVLEFPGKVKLNTITDESKMDISLVPKFSHFVIHHLVPSLLKNFRKGGPLLDAVRPGGEGPLAFMQGLRAKPFLISKSGPSLQAYNGMETSQSTSPASILASAYCWLQSPLYSVLTNWCKMTGNTWVLNRIESWAKELWVWEDSLPLRSGGPACPFEATNWLGKLGFKSEPAGKIRVFAMVDPWTQWLMDRLHRAIFKLLSTIPQDGTFDQLAPIHRLREWQLANRGNSGRLPPLYSFDLSAATDRIPVVLQKVLLSPFLTAWGAELWASLLVGRQYACPKTLKVAKGVTLKLTESGFVEYKTGQPMGALSSWAMLAFVHHAFVQWAALSAGVITIGEGWYRGYAILGDDVVIAGSAVASKYAALMRGMDVGIGAHKSLVSRAGSALEFAKRTFLNGVNVSMVPFSEFVMARQSLAGLNELVKTYSLSLGQTLSVLGYGYRAKANSSKPLFQMPKRLRNYILALYGPGGPMYNGLRSWLPMRSVTSIYKTVDTRVHGLVERFFEVELRLAKETLATYQHLVDAAKKLGTVYRDREHYGTISRGASGLVSKITNPDLTYDSPIQVQESKFLVDGRWMRKPTLEEYNALLERAWLADRDPNKSPFVQSSVVPSSAPLIPTSPPTLQGFEKPLQVKVGLGPTRSTVIHPGIERSTPQSIVDSLNETVYREAFLDVAIDYRDLCTKLEEISISTLDWDGIENLWAAIREIERRLGELPFPKNILTRTKSEGNPVSKESKVLKRWYRHSSTFRATVNPASAESTQG